MNNELMVNGTVKTMTSNEIAELTGKEHKHVMRDIRNLVKSLGPTLDSDISKTTYQGKRGSKDNYTLKEDGIMLLITGYSAIHRMKVIKELSAMKTQLKEDGFIVADTITNPQIEQAKKVFSIKELVNDLVDENITMKKFKEETLPHFKSLKFDLREKEIKSLVKKLKAVDNKLSLAHDCKEYALELTEDLRKSKNRSAGRMIAHRDKLIKELAPEPIAVLTIPTKWFSVNKMYTQTRKGIFKSVDYKLWINQFPSDECKDQLTNLPKSFTYRLGGAKYHGLDYDNLIKAIQDQLVRTYNLPNDNSIKFDGWKDIVDCTHRKDEFIKVYIYEVI